MKTKYTSQMGDERTHRSHRWLVSVALFGMLSWPFSGSSVADSWTGLGISDNWSDPNNWLDGSPPLSTDSVVFNATDSGNTSIIDLDFFTLNPTGEITGLQYVGNGVHTTDFAGSSLQVNGPVYVGYGGSDSGGAVAWSGGGSVQVGDSSALTTFYIGASISSATVSNTGALLLDDVDAYAYVTGLTIGAKMHSDGYGTADGSLALGTNSSLHIGTADDPAVVNIGMNQSSSYYTNPYGTVVTSGGDGTGLLDATRGSVELHLSELNVGRHTGYYGTATGTLRWNQATAIDADAVYFGRGPSTGILDVPQGGTFLLGTAEDPLSLLAISYNDTGHGSGASTAQLDFSINDPTFIAYASTLTIGGKMHTSAYGTADGSLILGDNSSLHTGTLDALAAR